MFSNSGDVWSYLRSSITFKTYSDEKLASLYLDNPDDFPIDMLIKVFDVILDPQFKLEDITFKKFSDVFDYVSEFRRQATVIRIENEVAPICQSEARAAYSISPLVVSLVADKMVEDRLQLGTLAEEEDWREAYKMDVANFHSMSLVHSSWRPIAQRALHRRAVIPYYQVNNFLLSPLCGPWVTEMVVYWTSDNDLDNATLGSLDLFQALLERTCQLKSFAFVSSPKWRNRRNQMHNVPPSRASECVGLISDLVPNLENLWWRHLYPGPSAQASNEATALIRQLAKLQSLKLLSVRSWDALGLDKLEEHPSLEIVEVEVCADRSHRNLIYVRVPREEFSLSSLSCNVSELERIQPSALFHLEKLHLRDFDPHCHGTVLGKFNSLIHLELTTISVDLPSVGAIPTSLEYLKIENIGHTPFFTVLFRSNLPYELKIRYYCSHVRRLLRLRKLVLSDPNLSHSFPPEAETKAPYKQLVDLCTDRGIEFSLEHREGSFRFC